jgi:hypothetical protein
MNFSHHGLPFAWSTCGERCGSVNGSRDKVRDGRNAVGRHGPKTGSLVNALTRDNSPVSVTLGRDRESNP